MLSYPKWTLFALCTGVVIALFVGFIDSALGEPDETLLNQLTSTNPLNILSALKTLFWWDYAWLNAPWNIIVWPFRTINIAFILLISWETWIGRLMGRT